MLRAGHSTLSQLTWYYFTNVLNKWASKFGGTLLAQCKSYPFWLSKKALRASLEFHLIISCSFQMWHFLFELKFWDLWSILLTLTMPFWGIKSNAKKLQCKLGFHKCCVFQVTQIHNKHLPHSMNNTLSFTLSTLGCGWQLENKYSCWCSKFKSEHGQLN